MTMFKFAPVNFTSKEMLIVNMSGKDVEPRRFDARRENPEPDFRQISRNLPKRGSRGSRMKVENRERKQGENGFARTYS